MVTGDGALDRHGGCGPVIDFRLLGPFEVCVDGQDVELGSPKMRVLLAALVLQAGRPVSVGELAETIWGDVQPGNPRRAVQLNITRLRKLLAGPGGRQIISTHAQSYQLDVGREQVDLGRFEHWAAQVARAADHGDLVAEAAALNEALAQWRGEPLADLPSERLQRGVAAELREKRLQMLGRRFDVELRRGRHAEVVGELSALTAQHPLREGLWAQLMTALHKSGRRADALAAFHTVRLTLAEELGIEPGAELRALHAMILAGRPLSAHGDSTVLPPVPRQLPPDVSGFTGRAEELAQLDDLLDDLDDTRPVVSIVSGTAGVGKTALAAHWARRVADMFPDGQLWVNLRGYDPGQALTPEQALNRFLRALGVPDTERPLDLDDQVGLYRSLMDGRRMLLVLDNAGSPAQIRPLLPGAPGCLVVVTSRNQLSGLVATAGGHPLILDLLTADEAYQLLAGRLGAARISREPAATREIVDLCARLPLALAIVAARAANHPEFGLHALAAELGAARGSLDAFTGPERVASLRAVFSWSYNSLGADSALLFRLLGLHPGPDIASAAAASLAGIPVSRVRAQLLELCDAHLVTEHVPGRYSFHDLLRAYAAELVLGRDTEAQRRRAQHRMLDHYQISAHKTALLLGTWEPLSMAVSSPSGVTVEDFRDHRRALAWCNGEHHTLLAVVKQAGDTGFPTHTWLLAWTLAEYLYRQGHWHDWVLVLQTALDWAMPYGSQAEQARAHRELARAYARLGHLDTADAYCKLALKIAGELDDPVGLAFTHRVFGIVLETAGFHQEALKHDQQALELFNAAGHLTGEARALNAIGWGHALLGNYDQALTYCLQALTRQNDFGDRKGLAATWDSLGYAHHHLGHHREAAACYQHSLELFQDIGDRYKETDALTHLGDTHLAAGDPGAARDAWQQAWEILTDLGHSAADPIRIKLRALDTPGAGDGGRRLA